MAASPRGLVCVLTMVAWLASSIRTGSSASGWWGSQEALQLRQAARHWITEGNFDQAERAFRHGADVAAQHRDLAGQAGFLEGVGSARFAGIHYRGALDAYLQARSFAERGRDALILGGVDANLASLYQQMGDVDSAIRSAEEARAITARLTAVYYRPQLLFLLGSLRADATSISLFKQGIQAAHTAPKDSNPSTVEASGWDYLCQALLQKGDVAGADTAEQRALVLRQGSAARDLGYSNWLLGAVRLRQAEQTGDPSVRAGLLDAAANFTIAAAAARRGPPAYQIAYQQGSILLAQVRVPEALEALEHAVAEAEQWRLGIGPAQSVLDGAAAQLQAGIFDRFIQAAADYGLKTHNQRWVEESLEAAELNRAANLRDSAGTAHQQTLPPEYWEVLSRLRTEEFRLFAAKSGVSELSGHLKLELTEMEARAGLGYSPNIAENFPSQGSLIHFQQSLGNSGVLLSFSLEERESLVWAVTRDTLHVYRLPPAGEVANTVREFRQALEETRSGFEDLGERLYSVLFGQLDAHEAAKPVWRFSVDDALLEVPFAALVPERERPKNGQGSGRVVFLSERHSLEVSAGAMLPGKAPRTSPSGFVSVGDPIYNVADPRWTAALQPQGPQPERPPPEKPQSKKPQLKKQWPLARFLSQPPNQLNRLPGTRREVDASAAAWSAARRTAARGTAAGGAAAGANAARGTVTVLEGASASRARFLHALSPVPQVIHLATHALTSSDEGYLAFSLGPNRQPETLSTSEIRRLHVPGSVVVMTGCSTAPGDVRPGQGLAGLVRAWTVAGASAVVATEWAVDDSRGSSLLASFYRYLSSAEATPAEALRLAQVETIRSGAAGPATWAAYQIFAGQTGSAGETRSTGETGSKSQADTGSEAP